jgi:glycosyltransferase involved in cell wall biosynthesis
MVVVEALARGVPVIASKGTPWRRLEEVGCGPWVSCDAESLAVAIEGIRKMPLSDMGERGREWMVREFSWPSIARQMLGVYRDLVERGS